MKDLKRYCVFDTETTGLPVASILGLEKQPEIIEYAAVKVETFLDENDHLQILICDSLEFMCRPKTNALDPKITKITGIKFEDVENKEPFSSHIDELISFHKDVDFVVAHNVQFDRKMCMFELERLGLHDSFFGINPTFMCTVEATFHLKNHRLKLSELYEMVTGLPPEKSHRAMGDVNTLVECFKWILREEIPL